MNATKTIGASGFLAPNPFAEPGPTCPKCGADLCMNGNCIDCEDRARHAQRDRYLAMGDFANEIPPRWQWVRFDAPELAARVRDTRAMDVTRNLAHDVSVAFTGGAGAGKTTLACCIARTRAMLGIRVAFATSHDLARARAAAPLGTGEPELVRHAMKAPLLILDDLGQEPMNQQSAVSDVIYTRHNHLRPSVVTSCLDLDGIAKRYGDGIARRVFEKPNVTIHCRGGK